MLSPKGKKNCVQFNSNLKFEFNSIEFELTLTFLIEFIELNSIQVACHVIQNFTKMEFNFQKINSFFSSFHCH